MADFTYKYLNKDEVSITKVNADSFKYNIENFNIIDNSNYDLYVYSWPYSSKGETKYYSCYALQPENIDKTTNIYFYQTGSKTLKIDDNNYNSPTIAFNDYIHSIIETDSNTILVGPINDWGDFSSYNSSGQHLGVNASFNVDTEMMLQVQELTGSGNVTNVTGWSNGGFVGLVASGEYLEAKGENATPITILSMSNALDGCAGNDKVEHTFEMASKTDSDIVFFTQGSALSKNIVKYANKYDTDFYVMTGPGGTLAHGVSNEVMSSQSKAIFDPKNYEFNNFEYYFKDNKGKLYGETQHDLGQPYLNVVIKKYNHETHEYENISNEEMQGVLSKNLVSDLKNELFKTNKTYNTNNEYDKYTISTKYQSVNDGINGIIGVLNNSFYTPSNPTFKNNQLLTSRINGIISTVSTSSNIILNDTGNIANLFGGLLQNYSYLENELSKDVNDIGVLASDLVYLSSDIKDYNPYILVFSNDEYKFDINEKVIEGKIGSLSVNEIDNLLSNSGVVNSLFNNEIENSTLLIKQIDELINSEINGPAWNEAKSLLICLKKNHEIRIRSAKYLKGELTNILQNLKNYIEPDSEITDENLNELENKISSLENEIHSLESQVSYMDDYVYYEDKYGIHKEGNPHKAQMQALIREKYNQLSSLRQIVNRIKGYCNLMNISINSINNLYNEVETSSSYYGGLVQIPNINAKDLDTLSIYRNNR